MNWKTIIEDLIKSGLSEEKIQDTLRARLKIRGKSTIGTSQSTINRIRQGSQDPRWVVSEELKKLHAERCQDVAA